MTITEKYLRLQASACEISQIESCGRMWDFAHMTKPDLPDIGAEIVQRLNAARPIVAETGKPLSDNRWCELAGVNTGYWRDLRKGTEPGVNRVASLARVARIPLARLVESAETKAATLPSEERLFELIAGLLEAQGVDEDRAASLAGVLAVQLPTALEQFSGPLAFLPNGPATISDGLSRTPAKRNPSRTR